MKATRRSVLGNALTLTGFSAASAGLPRIVFAQDGDAAVTRRLQDNLQAHASFGLKFSASPGDHATADWTAERLRTIGYRVEVSEFDARLLLPVVRAHQATLARLIGA